MRTDTDLCLDRHSCVYFAATCFGQQSATIWPLYTVFENRVKNQCNFFFPWRDSPQWAKVSSLSRLHGHTQTHTHTHAVGLLWTSGQSDADTSTWQHTPLRRDRHPCPRRDSNPKSQKASGRTPPPWRVHCSHYVGRSKIVVVNSKGSEHVRK